ncbi:MAG: nuclear transport factor 2 family protein [Pseudorhodoplanes sp.]
MPDRAALEELVRTAYDARKNGDLDAVNRIFSENVHFRIAGDAAFQPMTMRAEGLRNFRLLLKEMITVFEWIDQEILSIVIEGSKVAVHWRGGIRSAVTGDIVVTECADFFEIEGGRVSSLVEFCDSALLARLTGTGN